MFVPARFPDGPNFLYRVGLTWSGDIEAAAPNLDYPRCPDRVVICPKTGDVIDSNLPDNSDRFRRLVRAARRYVKG